MKLCGTLLVVKDIEKSKQFYQNVLDLHVTSDFGANVTLTGGLSLQTFDSWKMFIKKLSYEICFKGNNYELYFEEECFDEFIKKLYQFKDINYVHMVIEHGWGQRAVRFYDLDGHIIEVAESLKNVANRFLNSGMTENEIALKMDVPLNLVQNLIKK